MTYAIAALGGALIGLSAVLFLLLNGRIAGVSGIVADLLPTSRRGRCDLAFVIGLLLGPAIVRAISGGWPVARPVASGTTLAVAGLLVGFGTRLGSGCTSGHGVCGVSRLSPRSLIATATFMITGIATVAAMDALGVAW